MVVEPSVVSIVLPELTVVETTGMVVTADSVDEPLLVVVVDAVPLVAPVEKIPRAARVVPEAEDWAEDWGEICQSRWAHPGVGGVAYRSGSR